MNLQYFVRESLIQLSAGVKTANDQIANASAKDNRPFTLISRRIDDRNAYIEFDVAVFAKSEHASGAGGGLDLSVVSIGGGKSDSNTHETASRIKFRVTQEWQIS